MIIGIGIDLVDIERFSKNLSGGQDFQDRVFSDAEIQYCEQYRDPAPNFAGKFAAKEAYMKAIGAGLRQGVWFDQIEVLNDAVGKPIITLHGSVKERQIELGECEIHVSISHTRTQAIAVIIIEYIG